MMQMPKLRARSNSAGGYDWVCGSISGSAATLDDALRMARRMLLQHATQARPKHIGMDLAAGDDQNGFAIRKDGKFVLFRAPMDPAEWPPR